MESEFKNIAEQTVGVIQKQIDLLKERNALAGGMQGGLPNDTPTERRPTLIDPYTGRPLSGGGGAVTPGTSGRALNTQLTERQQTTLDKILSEVVRIADLMEKTQRDDTNGVLPTGSGGEPPQPPAPETPDLPTPGQGGGAGLFGKGFKMPTSMSGLMGMLPFGALIMGIGTILGQQAKYESAQYGAENEFQRRNNRGNHWLLNMLTFGISGAEAEKKEVGRNAATQNDRALGDYAALHRMSYRQALGSQFVDSFGDNVDYVTGGNTSYHDYKMATDWSYRQKQEQKKVNPPQPGTIDLDGLVAFPSFAIHYYVIAKIRQRTTTTVRKRTFPIFIPAKRTVISWSVVSSTSIILLIKKDLPPLSGSTAEDWKPEKNIFRRSSWSKATP